MKVLQHILWWPKLLALLTLVSAIALWTLCTFSKVQVPNAVSMGLYGVVILAIFTWGMLMTKCQDTYYEQLHISLLKPFIKRTAFDPPKLENQMLSLLSKCIHNSAHAINITYMQWSTEKKVFCTEPLFPEAVKDLNKEPFTYLLTVGKNGFLNCEKWAVSAEAGKIDFLQKSITLIFKPTSEVVEFNFNEDKDSLELRFHELIEFAQKHDSISSVIREVQEDVLEQLHLRGLRPEPEVTKQLLSLAYDAMYSVSFRPDLELLRGLAISKAHNTLPDDPRLKVVKLLEQALAQDAPQQTT